VTLTDPNATTVHLRFDDPTIFLQFYRAQFLMGVLHLPTPAGTLPRSLVSVVVALPGCAQALELRGRVVHRTGAGNTRIRLLADPQLEAWLAGYTAALSKAPADRPETTEADDPRGLGERLDRLTYYELLGTPRDATARVIQRAFHGLSRHYHPDLFYGVEPERLARVGAVFRRINEAYSVLRVAERRRAYDRGLAGPRHHWRLRWSSDESSAQAADRVDRGAHYWARAAQRIAIERPPSAPPDVDAIRLLRTACALEPEQEQFRRTLDALLSGKRLRHHTFTP
jgi:hypothetical protein